jgi:hypothetical protein
MEDMGMNSGTRILCRICNQPVNLTFDTSTDENGQAVHELCYARTTAPEKATLELATLPTNGNNKEQWRELCKLAASEQDPEKLMALVAEIDRLLEKQQPTRFSSAHERTTNRR